MKGSGFFTSDLSVNEFLLVKEAGFEPLGLVIGTSIYHVGFQVGQWNQNQEMDVLSQAMYHARELAMTRMEEEADQLGADGVVGVRLDVSRHEWGGDLAEFIAVGTAVRHRDGVLHRANNGRPFTSDLSGQDFYTLLSAGYRPLGLVMGTACTTSPTKASAAGSSASVATPRCRTSPRRSTTPASSRWNGCRARPSPSAQRGSSASSSPREAMAGTAT